MDQNSLLPYFVLIFTVSQTYSIVLIVSRHLLQWFLSDQLVTFDSSKLLEMLKLLGTLHFTMVWPIHFILFIFEWYDCCWKPLNSVVLRLKKGRSVCKSHINKI